MHVCKQVLTERKLGCVHGGEGLLDAGEAQLHSETVVDQGALDAIFHLNRRDLSDHVTVSVAGVGEREDAVGE